MSCGTSSCGSLPVPCEKRTFSKAHTVCENTLTDKRFQTISGRLRASISQRWTQAAIFFKNNFESEGNERIRSADILFLATLVQPGCLPQTDFSKFLYAAERFAGLCECPCGRADVLTESNNPQDVACTDSVCAFIDSVNTAQLAYITLNGVPAPDFATLGLTPPDDCHTWTITSTNQIAGANALVYAVPKEGTFGFVYVGVVRVGVITGTFQTIEFQETTLPDFVPTGTNPAWSEYWIPTC